MKLIFVFAEVPEEVCYSFFDSLSSFVKFFASWKLNTDELFSLRQV